MKRLKIYILLVAVLSVSLLQVGCSESARVQSAQNRFDRVLEQARMDAAMESIEQGRLQYAIRLLEYVAQSDSALSVQAKSILKELRFATQQMALAREADTEAKTALVLN